jgi:hypothetical protein
LRVRLLNLKLAFFWLKTKDFEIEKFLVKRKKAQTEDFSKDQKFEVYEENINFKLGQLCDASALFSAKLKS